MSNVCYVFRNRCKEGASEASSLLVYIYIYIYIYIWIAHGLTVYVGLAPMMIAGKFGEVFNLETWRKSPN